MCGSGSKKLLNTDTVWIRIHNTGCGVGCSYLDVPGAAAAELVEGEVVRDALNGGTAVHILVQ